MGLTHIEATIANPANLKKTRSISLLVDSGAVYSVVPKSLLAELGNEEPRRKQRGIGRTR